MTKKKKKVKSFLVRPCTCIYLYTITTFRSLPLKFFDCMRLDVNNILCCTFTVHILEIQRKRKEEKKNRNVDLQNVFFFLFLSILYIKFTSRSPLTTINYFINHNIIYIIFVYVRMHVPILFLTNNIKS